MLQIIFPPGGRRRRGRRRYCCCLVSGGRLLRLGDVRRTTLTGVAHDVYDCRN
jgi:hypothetical protein